ncbi:phosphatase PAP2 family protein [Bacteroidota bacterium]
MKRIKDLFYNLSPSDIVVITFLSLLTFISIIFHNRVEQWIFLCLFNIVIILFVFLMADLYKKQQSNLLIQIRTWYIIPIILLTFKELYFMVKPIRGVDYDDILIAIDRFIFGFDPTVELYKISNPLFTEILQIAYATFFFLPVLLGIDLMVNKRYRELDFAVFIIVLGFFLSYIGYLLVPAVGPRFTLHDFYLKHIELPGLFLTDFLRHIVNSGESITYSMPNAIEHVQRDVFPSGHTQMTLLTMYMAIKFRTKSRYFLIPDGILLIIATVYLRYHYVIDIIFGGIFMVFTLWFGKRLYNWWMHKKSGELFEYPQY